LLSADGDGQLGNAARHAKLPEDGVELRLWRYGGRMRTQVASVNDHAFPALDPVFSRLNFIRVAALPAECGWLGRSKVARTQTAERLEMDRWNLEEPGSHRTRLESTGRRLSYCAGNQVKIILWRTGINLNLKKNRFGSGRVGLGTLPKQPTLFTSVTCLRLLWISYKNSALLPPSLFRRCWPFNLAMQLFYGWAPQIWVEKLFYFFFPLWRIWLNSQKWPDVEVVMAIVGYATEPFDHAEKVDALRVVDCPNSHPTSYFGFWQRECDLWCPGERVPIPRWFLARMNRELQRADLIIVQSKFCKESMVYNGIQADKVMVNPVGVDTSIFKKREIVPEKVRFISVGTIRLRKGHQYLFRAFEIIKRSLPEAELICVGAYKVDFRKERPKWEGRFTHYDHLSHDELAPLLRTCTAFVFPSREEGIARAQIEALASGLPVIGTHEGGATTLVNDGVEGFIVPGCDPERIAEAMLKVALDRDLNRRMGNAAYRKGAERNTWQDYGDRMIQEFCQRRLAGHTPAVANGQMEA
jgi:glycosyltransferase involved in cell wall biosynthesis